VSSVWVSTFWDAIKVIISRYFFPDYFILIHFMTRMSFLFRFGVPTGRNTQYGSILKME